MRVRGETSGGLDRFEKYVSPSSSVGVFNESERRDIWWVGLGVKCHGR